MIISCPRADAVKVREILESRRRLLLVCVLSIDLHCSFYYVVETMKNHTTVEAAPALLFTLRAAG